ncbi:unnamed protein product [Mytilus coruscus]|uniref:Uncharacterized protein n=1 Tax=Mytilus coruscus TaxID=42192 RepID=A0A6J8C0C5_MYTCO|nr:unnamed protein product [Mytilus coruscus]
MLSVRFGYIIIFLCHFQAIIVDGFEQALSWEKARDKCNTYNQILSPLKSITKNLKNHYRSVKSVWTANYGLHLGCTNDTGFCPGLKIEQVRRNESHQGICKQNSSVTQITTKNSFERACKNGNLVDIINMVTLSKAMEKMEINTTYWINSISIDPHGFVLFCQLYTNVPNKTEKNELIVSSNDCKSKHEFICSGGDGYGTVISKIQVPNYTDPSFIPLWKKNKSGVNSDDGGIFFQISGTVSTIVIVFGLIIIGCLLRRWISKMKKELIETLRQKYEHHMYEVERVEPEPESVPETPVSLGGDSLYENVHTGNDLSREANMTVSYMTSREIRRPVTVPTSAIEAWTQNAIPPRLTLPQRLPSREKAIRRKTGSRQLNTHLKQTRKKQSLPETSQQSQLNSSGHVQKKNDEISKVEASAPLTIHRPKPSPKPHTKDVTLKYKNNTSRIKEGIQIHDISGEFAFNLNTGQSSDIENTEYLEENQEYENIWQSSNEQSI